MGLIAYKKGDKWNEKLTKDFYTCFENIHTKQLKSIHINKLKKKHADIVDDEALLTLAQPFFEEWCKIIGKVKTQWNKDFFTMH